MVYNAPALHPRIQDEEREYIEKALQAKGGKKVCKAVCTCGAEIK